MTRDCQEDMAVGQTHRKTVLGELVREFETVLPDKFLCDRGLEEGLGEDHYYPGGGGAGRGDSGSSRW